MRRTEQDSDVELEPIEDKTEALVLRSKRTERAQRKQKARAQKPQALKPHLLDLPYELVMEILQLLRPSSLFSLYRVSKAYRAFILQEESTLAASICRWRYQCLKRCFRTPVPLEDVDPSVYSALQSLDRNELKNAIKKPFHHIQPPDPYYICTCFTCLVSWNSLCIIVDFAHWQDNLDGGEPIPMIPRGSTPEWNKELLERNATIVRSALHSPLWHARLLEEHLKSITRAIRRHAANKGNKRSRYKMTEEDVDSGTDQFLAAHGPATLDIPFTRDNYYMLEAFLPNRGWSADYKCWFYVPDEQHETDVRIVVSWAKWRASQAANSASKPGNT
ncbi:hypothetical protein BX600DRAFT_388791 [Xylariales sp. PMI_506]|nr:hypothetical protein BX600DRAFT_388791 [Xylariales sp. PMI_506]